MYLYRLVYILATKNGGGWEQIDVGSTSGEFKNRAGAKDFVDRNKDNWDSESINVGNFIINGESFSEFKSEIIQNVTDISNVANNNTEIINQRGQTFFEIMTQQPNKFTIDSSSSTTNRINISWNYDDIIAKDNNGNDIKLAIDYNNPQNLSANSASELLPVIYPINIDISQGY